MDIELRGDGREAQWRNAVEERQVPARDLHRMLKHDLAAPPRRVSAGAQCSVLFGNYVQWFSWIWVSFSMLMVHSMLLSSVRVATCWHLMASHTETVPAFIMNVQGTDTEVLGESVVMFEYNYTTATGETYIGKSYQTGNSVSGEPVAEYSLRAPRSSVLKGMRVQLPPWWLFLVIGLFPVLGAAMLAYDFHRGMQWLALLKRGVKASATLVNREITTRGDDPAYALTFEFWTSATQTHTLVVVQDKPGPRALEDAPREIILYDPSQPDKLAKRLSDYSGMWEVAEDGSVQGFRWHTAFVLSMGPGLFLASNIFGLAVFSTPT